MIERIDEVLEKKVRPALLSHEGDVQIVEYADGVLKIRLTGHCSGCPSARLTTEELIAAEVQKEIPEVKEVVLVNEISPELLVSSRLDALINYDRENKTELYRTLQVYLEHERNSLQTAKTLFIHRSSLVYRLERIQKITKIDLDNPRNRLLLQICFLLIQEKEPASD